MNVVKCLMQVGFVCVSLNTQAYAAPPADALDFVAAPAVQSQAEPQTQDQVEYVGKEMPESYARPADTPSDYSKTVLNAGINTVVMIGLEVVLCVSTGICMFPM